MKKSIFLFFAAILCSVSAWAFNVTANYYVYFEKPSDWSNVSILLGHSTWSQGYNFTKISNTNLYYWKTPSWSGATEYYFIDATGWGGEGKSPTNRKGYAPHASSKFTTNFSKYHLFTSSKEVKKDASSYATAVNRTQTIKVQVKDGENWGDATITPADLTASTYALTSVTAAGAKSASLAKESTTVSATVDAAYSATVTLSCTNIADGYMFDGWYDANGTKITSYVVSDAHTVYARFIQSAEETNEVTVSYKCGATDVAAAITEQVGVETEKTFTAPTVTGYNFTGWTVGGGMTLTAGTASDAQITVVTKSASSDYTLVANYEEVIETIYFINTSKWNVVNLHRWNGTAAATAWPGTALTTSGEKIGEYDVYSFTAKQGDFAKVIFTNKNTGSDQTADLDWTAGKYYIYNYGGKSGWYTKAEAEEILVVPVVEETVYFVNNKNWTKVQAYAWNDAANNTWPGKAMTATGEKVAGFDVYSYTAPQGYVNLIFNNKTGETGVQSADFKWTNGKYYYMDADANYAGGTKDEVESALAALVIYDYYIAGSMNGWATNKADYGMALVDGVYKKELAFTKDAEFKVTNGSDWYGFEKVDANYQGVSDKDGNIKVDAAATFTVVYNKTTKKISFEGLTKIEDVYSIKGVDALGLNWTATDTKDDMTKQGDGSYLLVKSNITLAVGNYEYKAIKNHSWDWKAINSGNNLTLHVDKSGIYNITFTLNAEATKVAYTLDLLEEVEIVPDCYISGNATLTGGDGWKGTEFKMEYDDVKKLHYYTFDLKKDKTYELKAVCNDTWFGYDKLGAYYAEVTNKDGGIQVKLTADATVTVWFDYKTSKITFEGLTAKTFKDITFTITATSTPKIYWWNGGDKLANADWNSRPEMTPTANPNEYTYTLKDVDESTGVEYLITIGSLQTANQKTKVDVVANFKDLLTQVKVMGDFVDDWKTQFVMTIADDYKTASITMALGVKTYNFKVVEGGTWLGNSGTITKTVTGWTFEDGEDNCKITTTLAGNYIFTWNFETNKLSVTYPVKVTTPAVENGIFSVGNGEFVQFSAGNLQYNVGTNTWSFATNQYDYVGEANINVGDPTFTGTIDMFGWSADGKFGVNPSNKNEDYYGTFQDWGDLVNEADWYTLSADDWKYLLNTRPNAASLKQIAKIGDKLGIMLFPDAWTMPADVNVTPAYDSYFKVNIYNYNLDQWTKLEEAGAVFLPAAGRRAGGYGNMINYNQETETRDEYLVNGGFYRWQDNTNIYCYYWTSTINESTKDVSFLHNIQALGGDEYTIGTGAVWGEKGRYGQSVRLVKKATPDYERTVKSGDYGTICLPNGGLLFGASAFSVAKMEGTTILLDEVGTTMVAGTPYVVFPNTGATNLYVFYTDNANAPAGNVKGLYGSYTREPLAPNAGNYIMLPGNKYAEVTGDRVYVGENRAYFKVSEIPTTALAPAPGVRRIAIGQAPQVATGMENIDASAQPVKMIIDGQLFILRGEKMYDAQGKLVK